MIEENERSSDYNVLIIFDITDDKRRRRVNKVLEGFGVRIQKSAFECQIDIYQFERLVEKIERIINCEEDVLRIYRFTDLTKTVTFGQYNEVENNEFKII